MVQVRFCLLIAALCACCGLGSSGETALTPPPKPEIIDVDKSAVKSDPIPEITSTLKPSPSPNTTTTSTTTTSTETTTTSTSTATTTTPPSPPPSPPTPPPAPTPAPGPLPPPEQQTWSYTNSSNVTCIVVQFAAQLSITYSGAGNLSNLVLNIPANATVAGGSCDPTDQFLTLSWPTPSAALNNTMTLSYARNDTTRTYAMKALDIKLTPDLFNKSLTSVVELQYGEAWQTPLTTSYRCTPASRLNLTVASVPSEAQAAYIVFTKLQEEAFRTVNGTQFSAARECGGDVPDAVPIAVGCALGGLVLVVLIAYLVGRRRSNARGYLSM